MVRKRECSSGTVESLCLSLCDAAHISGHSADVSTRSSQIPARRRKERERPRRHKEHTLHQQERECVSSECNLKSTHLHRFIVAFFKNQVTSLSRSNSDGATTLPSPPEISLQENTTPVPKPSFGARLRIKAALMFDLGKQLFRPPYLQYILLMCFVDFGLMFRSVLLLILR